MELLILFAFLTGWFVCWIQSQQSRYLTKEQSDYLMEQWLLDSQQWKSEYQELQLENQRLQSEIQKLKDSEMAQAQAREWDLQ